MHRGMGALGIVLAVSMGVTACGQQAEPAADVEESPAVQGTQQANHDEGHDHDHDHDHGHDHGHGHGADGEATITESDNKASLADWEGTWESLSAYFDDPELEESFAEHAEEHGESVEEVKEEFEETKGTEFDVMTVDDDTVTFIADKDADASESAVAYDLSAAYDVVDGDLEYTWFIFEAGDDASYPYLALMPQHGEESLVHFHMRYGDDVDAMLEESEWFPVLIKEGTADLDMIEEEIFEHAH